MKIDYARVSTADQYLRMQDDALKSVGCEEIFTDVANGRTQAGRKAALFNE